MFPRQYPPNYKSSQNSNPNYIQIHTSSQPNPIIPNKSNSAKKTNIKSNKFNYLFLFPEIIKKRKNEETFRRNASTI